MGITEFVFELWALKTKIKSCFSRSYCCYDKLLYKGSNANCLPMTRNLYDTIIVASFVTQLQSTAVKKSAENCQLP